MHLRIVIRKYFKLKIKSKMILVPFAMKSTTMFLPIL